MTIAIAIHEADGQDVTTMNEIAYSLVTGGGKPGQGYPCVMIVEDEDICREEIFQVGRGRCIRDPEE